MTTMIPPTDLHGEQAVIGELLRCGSAFAMIVETLRSEMFADPVHVATFGRILDYDQRQRDPALVIEDMRTNETDPLHKVLADVGGLPYLIGLRDVVYPAPEQAMVVVQGAWELRAIIDLGEHLRRLAEDSVSEAFHGAPPDCVARRLQSALQAKLQALSTLIGSEAAR